jgi:iron complex outermembrane receptor protein
MACAATSALLNVNGSVGRGSAAVDLNTIPTLALSQVEVLRDGASAQYGSDAIAGVMNLRLREASHGGGATVSYGQYDTQFNGARSSRHISDGGTLTVGAWQGFKLGNNGGFLTVTGEYLDRGLTARSDLDTRTQTATADPGHPGGGAFAHRRSQGFAGHRLRQRRAADRRHQLDRVCLWRLSVP